MVRRSERGLSAREQPRTQRVYRALHERAGRVEQRQSFGVQAFERAPRERVALAGTAGEEQQLRIGAAPQQLRVVPVALQQQTHGATGRSAATPNQIEQRSNSNDTAMQSKNDPSHRSSTAKANHAIAATMAPPAKLNSAAFAATNRARGARSNVALRTR